MWFNSNSDTEENYYYFNFLTSLIHFHIFSSYISANLYNKNLSQFL